jgi:hypothetical protein
MSKCVSNRGANAGSWRYRGEVGGTTGTGGPKIHFRRQIAEGNSPKAEGNELVHNDHSTQIGCRKNERRHYKSVSRS